MLGDLLPTALAGGQDLLRRSAELNLTAPRQSGRGSGAATVAVAASEAPVDVDRLVRMFGELPLLPHVLTAILRLTDKEPSDSLALAEAISSDPRLSSQLLRVVNSAYYGFARRISTIPEATVVLGSEAIRKLAVGAAACGFFSGHSTVLDRGKLWQHALAVASASRTVAEYRGLQQAEEAFAAGLLHDFGRLALERHCGPQYGGVVELARHEQIPLLAAEEQRLGLHHGWVSGWLARRWSLPDALTDAMANHHQPEAAVEAARYVTAAVNVGDVLAHLGGHGGIDQVAPTSEPSEYAMALLNLERHDLATLIQRASKAATELSQQLKSVMPEE
jgi:HD-like signal output (HDOD) protein